MAEVCIRITATTTNETIAPAARALTSIRLPMCARSLVPIATTSPVATFFDSVAPRWVAWRATSWTVRYAAVSQFVTANRCRMMPDTAPTRPMPSSTADHSTSRAGSRAAMPWSIALPITAGITADEHIQMMPNVIPPSSVRAWPFAIHHRNRTADRWSAVPGSSRGSVRTRPR